MQNLQTCTNQITQIISFSSLVGKHPYFFSSQCKQITNRDFRRTFRVLMYNNHSNNSLIFAIRPITSSRHLQQGSYISIIGHSDLLTPRSLITYQDVISIDTSPPCWTRPHDTLSCVGTMLRHDLQGSVVPPLPLPCSV